MKTIYKDYYLGFRPHEGKGIKPCLCNDKYLIKIDIGYKLLPIFGYVSNGTELGITGIQRFDNLNEQIDAIIDILSNEVQMLEKVPQWYIIKEFLKKYEGKTLLGKIIKAPKSTIISIKKTINIVDNEYQKICKLNQNQKI